MVRQSVMVRKYVHIVCGKLSILASHSDLHVHCKNRIVKITNVLVSADS